MKAENVQSNTSAPYIAGSRFGKFHNEQSTLLTVRLLDDAKSIHTVNDLKDYVIGYREALTISDSSRQAMASMVRTILKVATGIDAKLCDYHKVKTPAAGQKVVKAKWIRARRVSTHSPRRYASPVLAKPRAKDQNRPPMMPRIWQRYGQRSWATR
jgi:hypothetical protein